MHYFSGKGCSEFLESMHYCIGILSLVVYYKVYWFLYSIIVSQFSMPIELLSVIDFITIFFFLLSVVPCSELLKRGILKFLET